MRGGLMRSLCDDSMVILFCEDICVLSMDIMKGLIVYQCKYTRAKGESYQYLCIYMYTDTLYTLITRVSY